MASLDTVSIGILLGALLLLAGILSSLIAMRFGAPLLLVFLLIGILAGESGPGGIRFDDVQPPTSWARLRSPSFSLTVACARATRSFAACSRPP